MGRQLSLAPRETEKVQDWGHYFSIDGDIFKAYHGNKAAARRVRKRLQEVAALILPARKEMLAIMKTPRKP